MIARYGAHYHCFGQADRIRVCHHPGLSCRNAECFLQLLHLLNLDHSPEQGEDLCFEVLATLTALLCNNEASRSRLQDVVGYDTLFNIIVKLVDSHGPSEQLLMQLLGLVLEVTSCLRHAWRSPLKGLMYRPLICCCRTKGYARMLFAE